MKKLLSLIISVLILTASFVPTVMADDNIKIVIDGTLQQYDQMPVIKNSRTLVPLRGIFESLGAKVTWDNDTRMIIGSKGNTTVALQIDNTLATIGSTSVTLDVAPEIINSRTMVPVRFISEALGAEVLWDDNTRTVTINSVSGEVATSDETVIIDHNSFKNDSKIHTNGFGTAEFDGDVLNVKVETLPEKDTSVIINVKTPLTSIKEGDVCLMSFKAKVNSGTGYIKPWVQDANAKKALFDRTSVGSDWTECYLPFVGIADLNDCGIRFGGAVQDVSIKDFKIVNYGTSKTINSLPSTFYTENAAAGSSVGEKTEDGAIIIVDENEFVNNSKIYINGSGTGKFDSDILNVKVEALPEKDGSMIITVKTPLTSIKEGDVCLMSFKAKVNSGTGYIKPWVQDANAKKALFDRTSVGSDWTECYLPFVGIADLNDCGIRFGGAVQDVSIKDFKIVNYGTSKTINSLPSTFYTENAAAGSSVGEKTEDGAIIIVDENEFVNNSKIYINGSGTGKFDSDILNVKVEALPEKDGSMIITVKTPLTSIKEGDVCLMSFKAKVNSGTGYIKPWVQDTNAKKALFAETNLGSDWTECYLPFVGIADLTDCGIRFGGAVQDVSIKDFKIVNYKDTKTLESLPSTIK